PATDTRSLHDALPISRIRHGARDQAQAHRRGRPRRRAHRRGARGAARRVARRGREPGLRAGDAGAAAAGAGGARRLAARAAVPARPRGRARRRGARGADRRGRERAGAGRGGRARRPLRRGQHQARQVRRPHRRPADGAARARAGHEGDGGQHVRHQPGDGAVVRARPALRRRGPRRPAVPGPRPRAAGALRERHDRLRRRGLGPVGGGRVSAAAGRTWFGQPRGLTILFLTQMWELFSYYGMRTLLVYYMTKQLLFAQEKASFIYGTYTAMAYFTPILGGAIADRWLGKRNAVLLGGGIMALGHFAMAFEPLFYLGLATIALGNGLFLPSLPSQINDLYAGDDPRRGRAYNVYYVGLNLGGFLAPLVCGTLGELYGWHYGFGAAGIGMLAGLVVYVLGRDYLPPEAPRV